MHSIRYIISDQEAKENRDKIINQFSYFSKNPEKWDMQKMLKQAGAVLGQAQLKLEMDFTSINLHQIDEI